MYLTYYSSPLGLLEIKATDEGLLSVFFVDEEKRNEANLISNNVTDKTRIQLEEYFEGKRKIFDLPLSPIGTAFQQQVWQGLLHIPFGKTATYAAIAHQLNNPLSVRAVGLANGKNPISIIIPCHRVIGADGTLTGYAGGLWRKEALLKLEGNLAFSQPTLW